ncbi:hypothetical protein ACIGO8_08245 [Streptomyces sp. NPDC053493]|uniref:hypothetical protein n=1 Tax=Streptomyces sp. NPDC053493 TaxID=3365705 RepID=UPI0037D6D4CD
MSVLPPFSGPNPRCIKCGNRGAYTHYVNQFPQHLRRECDRCSYPWREATVEQELPIHVGGNAEDCPACTGTNPPYPFLCPGPKEPQP